MLSPKKLQEIRISICVTTSRLKTASLLYDPPLQELILMENFKKVEGKERSERLKLKDVEPKTLPRIRNDSTS